MAIKYKVDTKIPMPTFKTRASSRYPFGDMEVGDSFHVPLLDVASGKSLRQTSYAANRKHKGKIFRVADAEGGYRVFRVK
jgi:hypothetical protein